MDVVEPARLSVGFTRIGRLTPYQEARPRQTLGADGPDTRRNTSWDGRSCLARCGRVVLGRAVLKPRATAADQVTSHRALVTILLGLQGRFRPEELLPGP